MSNKRAIIVLIFSLIFNSSSIATACGDTNRLSITSCLSQPSIRENNESTQDLVERILAANVHIPSHQRINNPLHNISEYLQARKHVKNILRNPDKAITGLLGMSTSSTIKTFIQLLENLPIAQQIAAVLLYHINPKRIPEDFPYQVNYPSKLNVGLAKKLLFDQLGYDYENILYAFILAHQEKWKHLRSLGSPALPALLSGIYCTPQPEPIKILGDIGEPEHIHFLASVMHHKSVALESAIAASRIMTRYSLKEKDVIRKFGKDYKNVIKILLDSYDQNEVNGFTSAPKSKKPVNLIRNAALFNFKDHALVKKHLGKENLAELEIYLIYVLKYIASEDYIHAAEALIYKGAKNTLNIYFNKLNYIIELQVYELIGNRRWDELKQYMETWPAFGKNAMANIARRLSIRIVEKYPSTSLLFVMAEKGHINFLHTFAHLYAHKDPAIRGAAAYGLTKYPYKSLLYDAYGDNYMQQFRYEVFRHSNEHASKITFEKNEFWDIFAYVQKELDSDQSRILYDTPFLKRLIRFLNIEKDYRIINMLLKIYDAPDNEIKILAAEVLLTHKYNVITQNKFGQFYNKKLPIIILLKQGKWDEVETLQKKAIPALLFEIDEEVKKPSTTGSARQPINFEYLKNLILLTGKISDPDAIATLKSVYKNPLCEQIQPIIALGITQCLQNIDTIDPDDRRIVDGVIKALIEKEAWIIIEHCGIIALPVLTDALTDEKARIQNELKKLSPENINSEHLLRLISVLGNIDDPAVLTILATIYKELPIPAIIPLLRDVLTKSTRNIVEEEIPQEILKTIALMHVDQPDTVEIVNIDKALIPVLVDLGLSLLKKPTKALSTQDENRVMRIITLLKNQHVPEAEPVFKKALYYPNPNVFAVAAEGLINLNKKIFVIKRKKELRAEMTKLTAKSRNQSSNPEKEQQLLYYKKALASPTKTIHVKNKDTSKMLSLAY